MCLQHRREDDAVEHNIVFADEVNQTAFGILPPLLPCAPLLWLLVAQLLSVADVTDGRIKPHVEHLAFSTLHGHGNAPVQVTGDGTRFQSAVEPALALAIHVGAPFLMSLQNPVFKPRLILVERQIPMFRCLLHQRIAIDGIHGVDKFVGRQRRTTFLALVAIGTFAVATRTFTLDVAVGQELLRLFIIKLLRGLLHKLPLVIQLAEEVSGKLVVNLAGRTAIDIETDAKVLKRLLDDAVVAVHHILHRAPFLLGTNRHRHTVLIRAADKHDLTSLQTQVAHIDVCWHIHASQMSDMYRPIGIRQCRSNRRSFKVFLFHLFVFIKFGRKDRSFN